MPTSPQPTISSLAVHTHSEFLSKINSSSSDGLFSWLQPLDSQSVANNFIMFSEPSSKPEKKPSHNTEVVS